MNRAIELKSETTAVSYAIRFDGDDGIDEQKRALHALVSRCEKRGANRAKAMSATRTDAIERECGEGTSENECNVNGRGDRFRHGNFQGKSYMNVDDFTDYFAQHRASSGSDGHKIAVSCGTDSGAANNGAQKKRAGAMVTFARKLAEEWLMPDGHTTHRVGEKKHLPLSTIAVFFVIALSLMLMVSGTVMVAGAKREVSDLRYEVESLADEAALLEDRLESEIDYFEVYRVATEELGMVDAGFVGAAYLNESAENKIEAYTNEEDPSTGLATLLAAIGVGSRD